MRRIFLVLKAISEHRFSQTRLPKSSGRRQMRQMFAEFVYQGQIG